MRPQNEAARARLASVLQRNGLSSAVKLSNLLAVSVPTVHRILHECGDKIIRLGTTKLARYALRRAVRGRQAPISVYIINEQGLGSHCGVLNLIAPQGSIWALNGLGYPVDAEHATGAWAGLPYPFYDMRPQGYLGRIFAQQAALDLDVPTDPERWSDDHIVDVLSRRGADTPGNLILGDDAYALWLRSVASPRPVIDSGQVSDSYVKLASEAVALVGGGSSAGGEFPKFTAKRALEGSNTPHVIVKFSGADESTTIQRWSDLLVCEHLALETLQAHTRLSASKSRIIKAGGRTFLELERFDRSGEFGRSSLISLASLDASFIGSGNGDWPALIEALVGLSMVSRELALDVQVLWWFGRLIANNDMHLGNLSFQINAPDNTGLNLRLSPAYDMLPMFYAPLSGGEVPLRQFVVALPLPSQEPAWKIAHAAASFFWQAASEHEQISPLFRVICQKNLTQLKQLKPV